MDYSSLHEAIKDTAKSLEEIFNFISQAFQEALPYMVEIAKMMKDYKPKKKTKYKPVLEIRPKKIILLSKQLNRYYCRSSL